MDSSNGMTFYSTGSGTGLAMTLSRSGNVGIGTTAPNEKLELSVGNGVTGGLRINYAASATGEGMDITYLNNGSTTTSFDSRYNSNSAVMQFRMKTAATPVTAMTILGSGNVGIGTTSPTYNLEVSGSGYISGSLTVAGTITAQKLNVQQITSSVVYSSGSNIFGNSLANTQTFTGSIQATGSSHYLLGNVGIGTTAPQTLLTLNGSNVSYAGQLQIAAPDFAQITFYSSSAVTPGAGNRKASIIYNVGSNTFEVANQITNGHLILQGSDSGGGNVGIGTTTPTEKLEVQGNAKIGNDNTTSVSLLLARKNSNQAQVNYFIPAAESPTYQWIEGGYWTGENTGVSVANNSGKPYYESYIPAGQVKSFGFINQTTSGSSFNATAITASMVMYQGGNIALTPTIGNVGIGTDSPAVKLTVAGAISSSGATYVGGNLSVGTTYNGFAANIAGTTYVIGGSVWVNDGYGYGNANSANTGFYPSSSTALSLNSGGNTRMFIASGSGNVGIDKNNPVYKLDLNGSFRVDGTNGDFIIDSKIGRASCRERV
jgi:hypothetical protein